ncbi:Protein of unknown function [Thermobacillus xylanilyticus]|uniref:Uncharacterized protein n=1 Tax=Thermobacillus xylanilyticus TaxID=76633 RepID=A0ABM8V5Z0_THEXY|nr:Protein of unknown function [Thermobacillus xylanilyticus]
MPLEVKPWFTE